MSGSTTYYVRLLDSSGNPITSDTGQQWFDLSAEALGTNGNLSPHYGSLSFSLTGLDQADGSVFEDVTSGKSQSQIEIAGYDGSTLVSDDIYGDLQLTNYSVSNAGPPTYDFIYGEEQQTLYTRSASGAVQQSQSDYDFTTRSDDYSAPVTAPANNPPVASGGVVPSSYAASFSTSSGSSPLFSLDAFNFSIAAAPNISSATSGAGAGKASFSELTLTFAASDHGLPTFTAGTSKFNKIDIIATATGASSSHEVEDYQFKLALIKSVSTDQAGDETLTVEYGALTETYDPPPGGTPITPPPKAPPRVGGSEGSGGTTPASASVITVPSSDQPQTTTGVTPITPFAGASISDANTGSPTETVTVTPGNPSLGKLSDPNSADGSTSGNGVITLKGSAGAVTSELDALKFTPAFSQFGTTSFTITDTNSASLTASNSGASITVNAPPPPTAAQLKLIGADVLQFYKDTASHQSTTADVTKLGGDFTALDASQDELGRLLGQTLTSAMVGSSAATTLETDIANIYYPKIASDLSNGGTGLANDFTAMIGTTVGAGTDDLFRLHQGQSASAALAGAVTDFKLG